MKEVTVKSSSDYGYGFVPAQFLREGRDEFSLRNLQSRASERPWRQLRASEIEALVKNDNTCADWDRLLVTDPFEPSLVKNCDFAGLVRLGRLRDVVLQHHDFRVPAGIRNSTIISCDIGDDCSIRNCSYLSHYILGDSVVLSDVDEMQATDHAKFGNGILKDGEGEDVRIWIDVMNEAGGRSVLPFDAMIPADAYLWAAYRDDPSLLARLAAMTQERYGSERGHYGTVGSYSVIKSVLIMKDVAVGECAYIKGANKLKNLTILSSEAEPTQIGEGVEMVNGIVGYGCRVFYGSKAVRFVMGRNCGLKYGARLIHSILGDNSTVSCCELLNNLVFPAHEQHHNNSFLIASLVQGLSNIAAGATVGSNHNSRAPDGELRAGRGFWPGLCATFKHSSRFASYVLVAKGDYDHELDIAFPFSLVSVDAARGRLEVMPAYFWMYNMYALERNAWKTAARDKRVVKVQRIDFEYLAPDTADEIRAAMAILEERSAVARLEADGAALPDGPRLRALGRSLLAGDGAGLEGLEVTAPGAERSNRPVVLVKPAAAWKAYRTMLRYYCARALLAYAETGEASDPFSASSAEIAVASGPWVNLGGQLAPAARVDDLRRRIGAGEVADWDAVHAAYGDMAAARARDEALHALSVLAGPEAGDPARGKADAAAIDALLEEAPATRDFIEAQVAESRAKDFRNPFRRATYRSDAEMEAVLGRPEDNDFVRRAAADTAAFRARVAAYRARKPAAGRGGLPGTRG